jgi:hypothetical protein
MWGFIKNFFESDNDKLTNDPEYQRVLKKYDIEPVDWAGTDTSEDKARKAKKQKERQIKHRQEKAKRKAKEKAKFIEKYGKELGTKIVKGELWIGMNKEALMAIKGKPGKKNRNYIKKQKKRRIFL